jgi:CheY-like chemotaxis protein
MAASPRVLVCDDTAHVVRPVLVLLQAAGYRAEGASSALECVSLARAERPALILMDVMMPGMDGAFAAGMFRDEPELQGIPIVLFSAMPQEELAAAAAEVGAAGFLPKPFKRDELIDLVRKLAGAPAPRAEAV